MMTGRSLVSFGANIGDPQSTIRQAAEQLKDRLRSAGRDFRVSRLYRTPPVGGPSGQPPFVNAVAAIETEVDPWDLWTAVRQVEQQLGRQRNLRWEARRIDLDILLSGDQRIWTPHLKVPHPRMCMRRFILIPAAEVASEWLDPVSGKTIGQLATSLRSGRGSLGLISCDYPNPVALLEEAARLSLAKWRDAESLGFPELADFPESNDSAKQTSSAHQISARWVTYLEPERWSRALSSAKLLVFLAKPPPSIDIAWEDYHRELAKDLNLLPGGHPRIPLDGPRYLLAADDRQWAVHELVAALEAMDCPVEPLTS